MMPGTRLRRDHTLHIELLTEIRVKSNLSQSKFFRCNVV